MHRQAPGMRKQREIFKCPSGKREIILKEEQETAVNNLFMGSDVLAILSTGFRKRITYTIFAWRAKRWDQRPSVKTCVLVTSPLKSLIEDQIAGIESRNYAGLTEITVSHRTMPGLIGDFTGQANFVFPVIVLTGHIRLY